MMENRQDKPARIYAIFQTLRDNINQVGCPIEEGFVRKYQSLMIVGKYIGKNLSEFRVPDSEIKPIFTGEVCVDRMSMPTNIDAVLSYFKIITSEKPKRIEFCVSQE